MNPALTAIVLAAGLLLLTPMMTIKMVPDVRTRSDLLPRPDHWRQGLRPVPDHLLVDRMARVSAELGADLPAPHGHRAPGRHDPLPERHTNRAGQDGVNAAAPT